MKSGFAWLMLATLAGAGLAQLLRVPPASE
jgi:hypothetical protein